MFMPNGMVPVCTGGDVDGHGDGVMMQADGKTVFTSDEALDLEFVPEYVAIVGSGYIGLEFSDVYTALGAEVTFIEVSHATIAALMSSSVIGGRMAVCVRVCAFGCPLDSREQPITMQYPFRNQCPGLAGGFFHEHPQSTLLLKLAKE